jgi:glyoxylase-like metal-dependent hydrolase (beta-lactamase superfamily II)
MSDDRYRFKLGDFECLAILDNTFTGSAERMFSNVTPAELAPHLKANNIQANTISGSYNCLMVNTGNDDWVLIDTGIGDLQEGSNLLEVLEDEDIFPDHIILTHAHLDHYGGLIKADGTPNFPNAQVYMCRDEWAVFTSRDYLTDNPDRAAVIRKHLIPAENQIERVECAGEVLPGFTMIELPGHSPHHIGVLIESNGEYLIVAGDAVVHPLHIEHPEWHFFTDAEPETAVESRRTLAQLAVEHDALVMAYHFDFPGLGRIVPSGTGYKWKALRT